MVTYGVTLQRSDDLCLAEHPAGCTLDSFQGWCAERTASGGRLAVDLFSGAGGLSLGLEAAGWTVAVAVDNDAKAVQTHRHNFPGLALMRDLADRGERDELVDLLSQVEIDLVAGGPPCQPFSRAGRSKIRSLVDAGHRPQHDARRELWRAFVDIVLRVMPRAVLMENVPDMALGDDFRVLRVMVEALEAAGYHTEIRFVDAKDYDVPQHRKRLILLARRDVDAFAWPEPNKNETTVRDAIGDLPALPEGSIGARSVAYRRRSRSAFAQRMRVGMTSAVVFDHMTRPVRADDAQIFSMMDSRTSYAEIPAYLRRYSAKSFDDKYKRLGWDELSRSITAHIAKDGYWYIHPGQIRTLTVREAARIQTFPDHFRFAGTRSDAFRQIGNAVPPLLGEAASTALASRPDVVPVRSGGGALFWSEIREALTRWANEQRSGRHWYLLPGEQMSPLAAAASAVLGGSRATATEKIMDLFRNRSRPRVDDLVPLRAGLSSRGRSAVERLLSLLARKRLSVAEPDRIVEELQMSSSEERVFRLFRGEDVMVGNEPAIRVAAKVVGSTSYITNRHTDGRVDLARLVGTGEDAPLRAAGVRLLGSTLCSESNARCGECPLQSLCRSASDTSPTPLF